ncbi:MAG: DUF2917 domain-containing protein [Burkholderiales bacterium]
MNNELRHPLTELTAGSTLHVRDGQGRAVVVFEGQVWITQDSDLRDIVLDGGESFSLDHPGLTLVQALRDSKLMLVQAEPRTMPLAAANSYELYRWVRRQRSAAIGEALANGLVALRSAIVSAFTPAPKPPAPRPVSLSRVPR